MTWHPRYFVVKAPGVGGPQIPPDEPVLVIRAQDVLASTMLSVYIELPEIIGVLEEADRFDLADHLRDGGCMCACCGSLTVTGRSLCQICLDEGCHLSRRPATQSGRQP